MKSMGLKDFVDAIAAQAAIIADAFTAIADAALACSPPFTVLGALENNGDNTTAAPNIIITIAEPATMTNFAVDQILYSKASATDLDVDFDGGSATVVSIETSPGRHITVAPSGSWTSHAGHVIGTRP